MNYDELEERDDERRVMVVVPVSVLAKIDLNRDTLGRAEFVELCIDTLLGQNDVHQEAASTVSRRHLSELRSPAEETITRSELEEFKKKVKDLMQSYMDCMSGSARPVAKENRPEAQKLYRQLNEILED